MNAQRPSALIADDEPLLAAALADELANCWPELEVIATVHDGQAATAQALELAPDIVFLDVRMPGATGLEVAEAIAEDWPDRRAAPLIVFVTAYGEFALEAFERAAVDYLLKPVDGKRLARSVERLRARLDARGAPMAIDTLAEQLGRLMAPERAAPALDVIRAGVGDTVHLVPVDEVVLFEAADKYVVVHAGDRQLLIRESLRDLLPRLDSRRFAQIHRGAIVNMARVRAAVRGENGRLRLELDGCDARPVVSRLYAHLFRPM
ncbi:MAG: LytTR family DNA-binding domain-containing protein [Burkholderiaceae bacterium]